MGMTDMEEKLDQVHTMSVAMQEQIKTIFNTVKETKKEAKDTNTRVQNIEKINIKQNGGISANSKALSLHIESHEKRGKTIKWAIAIIVTIVGTVAGKLK